MAVAFAPIAASRSAMDVRANASKSNLPEPDLPGETGVGAVVGWRCEVCNSMGLYTDGRAMSLGRDGIGLM
jgi:hypothetical protein